MALMDAEAFTQEQWKETVHAAEDQPMLGQKMSKEFLEIAAGRHVLIHSSSCQSKRCVMILQSIAGMPIAISAVLRVSRCKTNRSHYKQQMKHCEVQFL